MNEEKSQEYKISHDPVQLEQKESKNVVQLEESLKDSKFFIPYDIEVNSVDEIVESDNVNQPVIAELKMNTINKNNQVEKITDSIVNLLISQISAGISIIIV